jgi:hypothetical protein
MDQQVHVGAKHTVLQQCLGDRKYWFLARGSMATSLIKEKHALSPSSKIREVVARFIRRTHHRARATQH